MFNIKIDGLDGLTKHLKEIQSAVEALDGEISTLKINPDDPTSVESEIERLRAEIDVRLAPFASNPSVSRIADELKKNFEQRIRDRVANAREDDERSGGD